MGKRTETSASRAALDELFDRAQGALSRWTTGSRTVIASRRAFLARAGACLACCLSTPLLSNAPTSNRQAPGFYRLRLGNFEVIALSDGTNPLPATKLLLGDRARIEEGLKRSYLGVFVETSHNSYLVNTGAKLILIDAGAGSLLGPSTGYLLSNLRASGYQPEQVDEVYLTHLHADHVGGLIGDAQRAFPNAIVRVDKRESDYWLSEANMRAAPEDAKRFFQAAIISITPYVQAGKLLAFEGNTELIRFRDGLSTPTNERYAYM